MIEKIEKPITPLELNNKVNEIIDNLRMREVGEFVRGFWSANHVPDNLLYCDGTELSGAEGQMFRNLYVDYLTGEITKAEDIAIYKSGVAQDTLDSVQLSMENNSVSVVGSLLNNGELEFTFITGDDITTQQTLCPQTIYENELVTPSVIARRYFYIYNGKIVENTLTPLVEGIEPNKQYKIKYVPNTSYGFDIFLIDFNGTQTQLSTKQTILTSETIYFGGSSGDFLGKMDLSQSYYADVNGNQVAFAYSKTKLDTCAYAEYETELTMTGSCWKWAVDTANEKFRIPFIPDKVLIDIDDTIGVRGNGMTLGLTNGTGNFGLRFSGTDNYGLQASTEGYGTNINVTAGGAYPSNEKTLGITTDPTKSGAEGVTTDAKTYKTIRHYVVVATGSINKSEADWSEFASSLASKANTDLSNTNPNASFRRDSVRWGIPDYEQMVEIEMPSNATTTYAAVKDGILWGKQISGTTAKTITINGNLVFSHKTNSGTTSLPFFFPVYQGDIVIIENTTISVSTNNYLYFAPFRE